MTNIFTGYLVIMHPSIKHSTLLLLVKKYVCRQRALKVFNDFESYLSQLSAFLHSTRYALRTVIVDVPFVVQRV